MLDIGDAAKLLKTLAIPLRLRILLALRDRGWIGVNEIIVILGEGSQSNVYEHLQALVSEGLLRVRRQDRKVLYNVGPEIAHAAQTLRSLAKKIGNGGDTNEDIPQDNGR